MTNLTDTSILNTINLIFSDDIKNQNLGFTIIEQNNINFEKRFVLENKQYDAYLPDHNALLEFDGEFWHPKSLEECKYYTQILNFHNDILKYHQGVCNI